MNSAAAMAAHQYGRTDAVQYSSESAAIRGDIRRPGPVESAGLGPIVAVLFLIGLHSDRFDASGFDRERSGGEGRED